jgi:hypothetical protein
MKNPIVLTVAAAFILTTGAYEVHAIPLSTLVGENGSIQVGDVLFNHFSFLPWSTTSEEISLRTTPVILTSKA